MEICREREPSASGSATNPGLAGALSDGRAPKPVPRDVAWARRVAKDDGAGLRRRAGGALASRVAAPFPLSSGQPRRRFMNGTHVTKHHVTSEERRRRRRILSPVRPGLPSALGPARASAQSSYAPGPDPFTLAPAPRSPGTRARGPAPAPPWPARAPQCGECARGWGGRRGLASGLQRTRRRPRLRVPRFLRRSEAGWLFAGATRELVDRARARLGAGVRAADPGCPAGGAIAGRGPRVWPRVTGVARTELLTHQVSVGFRAGGVARAGKGGGETLLSGLGSPRACEPSGDVLSHQHEVTRCSC